MSDHWMLDEEILLAVQHVLLRFCSVTEIVRFGRTCKAARSVSVQEIARRTYLDLRAPLLTWQDEDSLFNFIEIHATPIVKHLQLPQQVSLSSKRVVWTVKRFSGLWSVPSHRSFDESRITGYIKHFPEIKRLDAHRYELNAMIPSLLSAGVAKNLETICARVSQRMPKSINSLSGFLKLKNLILVIKSVTPTLYEHIRAFCALRARTDRFLTLKIIGKVKSLNLLEIQTSCQENLVNFTIDIALSRSDDGLLIDSRDYVSALTLNIPQYAYHDDTFWGTGFKNLNILRYYSESSNVNAFWLNLSTHPPHGLTELECNTFGHDVPGICHFIRNIAKALTSVKITILSSGDSMHSDRSFFSSIADGRSPITSVSIAFGQPMKSIVMLMWFLLKNQLKTVRLESFEYREMYCVPLFLLPAVLGLSRGLRRVGLGFETYTHRGRTMLHTVCDYVRAEKQLCEFQCGIHLDGTVERGHYVNGIFGSDAIRMPNLMGEGYVYGNPLPSQFSDVHEKITAEDAVKGYEAFIYRLERVLVGTLARNIDVPDDFDFRQDKQAGNLLADSLLGLHEDEMQVKAAFEYRHRSD
ncbi:hypothetical protein HDE_12908 [Halotydeus destructor]|nr:hypothetical protein HDE_12908 [Halotydeus destructor]